MDVKCFAGSLKNQKQGKKKKKRETVLLEETYYLVPTFSHF